MCFYRIQAELLKSDTHDVDLDTVSKITAQDLEDAANEEFAQFKFGSIETGKQTYKKYLLPLYITFIQN